MHTEYLEAKRSIDDSSLNRHVWDAFVVRSSALSRALNRPLRICEIGAGSGTMVDRLGEWRYFDALHTAGCDGVEYYAWEQNPDTARHIPGRIEGEPRIVASEVYVADITDPASMAHVPPGGYDILIAHAVVDLFSPEILLSLLERFLRPGGLLYAPIVFDGVTVFAPVWNESIDNAVMELYHRSMTSGGFARNHLLHLSSRAFTVVGVGSSDWIVPPRREGASPDEAQLIETILSMVESSVGSLLEADGRPSSTPMPSETLTPEQPAVTQPALVRRDLQRWLDHRREQLARGELLFEAHQLDLLVER